MHAPAPARERRKHGQAGQEAQQPPASPAAVCFSISNNYYKQSLFPNRLDGDLADAYRFRWYDFFGDVEGSFVF